MKLTGKDIHSAFCKVEPQARDGDDISLRAQQDYDAVAEELNRLLEQEPQEPPVDEHDPTFCKVCDDPSCHGCEEGDSN